MNRNEKRPKLTPWQTLDAVDALRTPWITVKKEKCLTPDGGVIEDYYVVEKHNFVIIFGLTADGLTPCARQYKHGALEDVLELPAGFREEGESPLEAARREFREETGYVSDDWRNLGTLFIDPSNCRNHFDVFLALNASLEGPQQTDRYEQIEVEMHTPEELRVAAREGRFRAQSSVAALWLAFDALREMGRPV